jgi:membrane protease YdiL (CAAX protease family)
MNVSDISIPVIPVMPNQKLEAETPNNNTSLAVSKSKFDLSRFNFLERGLKYFGAGVATSVISSKIMIPFMNSGMDWCPVFPKPVYTYVRNVCLVRENLPGLTGTYNNYAFKAPIVEELMFRVGLQELILKRAPKAILNRFAPSYSGIVDTKMAKIARVALTAAVFSLAHAMPPEMGWPNCSTARLVNTFVLGLILGGVQEVTESPLLGMLIHSGMNIQPAFLLEQVGMTLQCPSA